MKLQKSVNQRCKEHKVLPKCLWILKFKHLFLVQSEAEEVRQVLWLSVVLYKSPESELTCCLLLSNDTIYFLLEDSASSLGHHSGRTN